ncbi:hypothetical protein WICPIJ_001562 [Wickerhamomyces pijperi]|uniref:Uncharacterized protein n=1 Tax=Wickerhamomyces pijperi TaxID=599730 RepID=A0A9P8QAK4_WICPI|nr:hypothetical protein WICPIJ_001562 [Wickerhamomyces pijperi]
MKTSAVLPLAVLASIANSLVIPQINNQEIFAVSHKVSQKVNAVAQAAIDQIINHDSNMDLAVLREQLLPASQAAELISTESAGRNIIPHRYIIVFKDGVKPEEIKFHNQWVNKEHFEVVKTLLAADPTHTFFKAIEEESVIDKLGGIMDSFHIDGLLSGYFGYFLDDTIELIRRNPLVKHVELDSRVFASEFDTQNGAPWGLARISHRDSLSLGSFNKYLYDSEGGEGVTSYVIDTGVNTSHDDFEGRAVWGKTVPSGDADIDGNGHGTHCAGTIGSKHYGVAKKAKIVAVKVLRSNGSGTMSDVVKGVEYAANAHAKAVSENAKGFKGSTANMSLGGGKSPSLDLAVNAAVKAGIHFAVAAGNDNQDACNYSPAAAENAVTVGASTLGDARAYFSNWGECVDLFGPGLNILSTYIGSNTATATLSGTSMASPHVAGLLTYFLSLQPSSSSEFATSGSGLTPAQLKKKIIAYTTKDKLSDISATTPNKLIYNGAGQSLDDFWGESTEEIQKEVLSKVEAENALENLEQSIEKIYEDVKLFVENNL